MVRLGRDGPLADKVAVVTGGHRGIGRAISEALSSAGARVAIGCRNAAAAHEVIDDMTQGGGRVAAITCDVSDPNSVSSFGSAVREQFGVVDIVVANAGIAGVTMPMYEISLDQWRECIGVDLDGVFLTFKEFLPQLLERGSGGSLIAIGSMTGKRPLKGRTPYAAAKMGIIGLVRTLAEEVGPAGIRVNTISPGAVDGPRLRDVFAAQAQRRNLTQESVRSAFVESAALQRLTQAHEIGDACVFLASDASTAITGFDLNVTAGLVMY